MNKSKNNNWHALVNEINVTEVTSFDKEFCFKTAQKTQDAGKS